MPLRVIAGSAKGRKLKLVPGDSTRPIMDRAKEALFSILARDVVGAVWLDLFAGTGSVGIEALSRGAKQAIFVEWNRLAIQTIQANLDLTRLSEKGVIRRLDVLEFLKRPPSGTPPDYIYVAPPQYKALWVETLKVIDANPEWLTPNTIVIVQIDPGEYQAHRFTNLVEYDQRRYGNTLLVFMTSKTETKERPDANG